MTSRWVLREAVRLREVWQEALRLAEVHEGTFGSDQAEQKAYDELVDFVEENDLNHTSYDPR